MGRPSLQRKAQGHAHQPKSSFDAFGPHSSMTADTSWEHVEPPCIRDEHQALQYLGFSKDEGAVLITSTLPSDVTEEPLEALTLLHDVSFNHAAILQNHASPCLVLQSGNCIVAIAWEAGYSASSSSDWKVQYKEMDSFPILHISAPNSRSGI